MNLQEAYDGTKTTGPTSYGDKYWCIKSTLGPNGKNTDIYLFADYFEQVDGCILFYRIKNEAKPELLHAFACGTWKAVYAASCFDGSAVAVEHWEGEIARR